jgi:hypothetical protein
VFLRNVGARLHDIVERSWFKRKCSELYSGNTGFESRSGTINILTELFVSFLQFLLEIVAIYLKLGHDHYHPHPFQFMIYCRQLRMSSLNICQLRSVSNLKIS